MLIDYRQYNFIYKRASYEVYKQFRINKLELWLLTSLYWHLQYENRTVMAKSEWFGTITGNSREIRKMEGYFQGLIRLGCVGTFEYISSPGSVSVGLSDLGISILDFYDRALLKFQLKFPCHPYKLDRKQPSITDEPLPKYRALA